MTSPSTPQAKLSDLELYDYKVKSWEDAYNRLQVRFHELCGMGYYRDAFDLRIEDFLPHIGND